MRYINKIGIDKQLKNNIHKFIMTYNNSEIIEFLANGLKFVSLLNEFKEQTKLA